MKKTALIAILFSFFCLVNLAWCETDIAEITQAAKNGDTEAQFNLGFMYHQGQGVPQNYAEAMKWYRKAADQGLAEAQFNLAGMYYNGEGVKQNFIKAYVWWSLTLENGYEKANKILEVLSSKMTAQQIAQAQYEAAILLKQINDSKK